MFRSLYQIFNRTNKSSVVKTNTTIAEDLKDVKWENTKNFVPPIQSGLVIKVYDGDTITIATKLQYDESTIYRFSVRLRGIDCPEMKRKDDDESRCALLAKNILADLVLHKLVTLQNISLEKYGRILADVYLGDLHINNYMIQQRVAIPYNGKAKTPPSN